MARIDYLSTMGGWTRRRSSGVVLDILAPDQALSLESAWRALARNALSANAFFQPQFLIPALTHLGRDRVGIAVFRDLDRDPGAIAALFPVTGPQGLWRRVD